MSARINLADYDFVDFGCSTGGSMEFAERKFNGGRGIGIDISESKVSSALAAGREAALADATRSDLFDGKVRFSIMSHFLEHLPNIGLVNSAVATAVGISSSFVFIRQPWFDSDGYLLSKSLKFYWSDWSGHPLPLTSLQMLRAFRPHIKSKAVSRIIFAGREKISTSGSDKIVPISAPLNTAIYDKALHGEKDIFELSPGVYKELFIVASTGSQDVSSSIMESFTDCTYIFDSQST